MIKLKRLKINNFGSFRSENVIDFPESGLVLLHGDNGSGKSSVLKAIAYCLDFLSEPATEFINWDTQDPLLVELVLSLKGQDLIISRGTGFHRLEYGHIKAQGTEVSKKIETLLLNPTFMSIMSYRGQGEGGNFSGLKPAEKQDFLSELQSLNDFEKLIEKTELNISFLEEKINKSEIDQQALFSSAKHFVESIDRDEQLISSLQEQLDKASKEDAECLLNTSEVDEEISKLTISAIPTPALDVNKEKEELKVIDKQISIINESISNLSNQRYKLEQQISEESKLNNKLISLQNSVCPTCFQPWHSAEDEIKKILNKLEAIEVAKISLEELHNQTKLIQQELIINNKLQHEIRDLISKKTEDHKNSLLDDQKLKSAKSKRDYLISNYNTKKNLLKNQINQITTNLNRIKSAIQDSTLKVEQLDIKLEKLKNDNFSLKSTVAKETEILNSSKDFLRLITEDTLKLISSEASKVVQKLPNSKKFFINFDTSKLNKNGKIKKEIVLQILRNGTEVPFKRLSGGEKCSIHLATDLAVSHVLSLRTGKVLGWFIFDEALDGLSVENKKMAIQTLKDISKNKVILITEHTPEISEEFDKVIHVKQKESGSCIEFVSKDV